MSPGNYVLYQKTDEHVSAVAFFTVEGDGSVAFNDKRSELNLDFIFHNGKVTSRSKTLFDRLINEEDPYHFIRKV